MAGFHRRDLSLAESGALAIAEAASALDRADNTATFLRALERNRRVWQTIRDLADRHQWRVPNREQADYVLETARKMGKGVNDDHVAALINISRRVSSELAAGGDIAAIRERAYFIWQDMGEPNGQDLDHWLLAELECKGRGH